MNKHTDEVISSLNDEIYPFRITSERSDDFHIWIDIYLGRTFIRGFSLGELDNLGDLDYSRIVFEATRRDSWNMDNPIHSYFWECKRTTKPVMRKELEKIVMMEALK